MKFFIIQPTASLLVVNAYWKKSEIKLEAELHILMTEWLVGRQEKFYYAS
jgi:hypothetical protein